MDSTTGLYYTTDKSYIKTGVNKDVLLNTSITESQFMNVRTFPTGGRNCYTLRPIQTRDAKAKQLIRARFMYGNYDSKNTLPQFDLYLGVNLWDTINFTDSTSVVTKELLHIPTSNMTYICLVNTGHGVPFISALELRVILRAVYADPTASVALQRRLDFGNEDTMFR